MMIVCGKTNLRAKKAIFSESKEPQRDCWPLLIMQGAILHPELLVFEFPFSYNRSYYNFNSFTSSYTQPLINMQDFQDKHILENFFWENTLLYCSEDVSKKHQRSIKIEASISHLLTYKK